ncbi:MAG: hypothetical protein DPW21_08155 [Anaerolineae bacterium]|nr:hypothetical protein [Chloroflexi bacterium CFX1]MCQ3946656.1 hypothetical protein [Anaerolineae bacterium]
MEKIQKFKCWNCSKTFSQFIEITDQQQLILVCSHCRAECVVDLTIYPNVASIIYKSLNGEVSSKLLPEVLSTEPKE